jgi:adenylate cyclase
LRVSSLILALAVLLLVHAAVFLFPATIGGWDDRMNDVLFHIRYVWSGPEPLDENIAHINIDDASMARVDRYVWSRAFYADLLSFLGRAGSRGAVFDIIFARPGFAHDDSVFIASAQSSGIAFSAIAFTPSEGSSMVHPGENRRVHIIDSSKWAVRIVRDGNPQIGSTPIVASIPALLGASRGIGFINAEADPDGVYRRMPLLMGFNGSYYPSLAFRVACDYLQVSPDSISVEFGRSIVLHSATFPGGTIRDIVIPIDNRGRLLLNYPGYWKDFAHYSFTNLMDNASNPETRADIEGEFAGTLAFIGETATGSSDIGPTPLEDKFPLVGIHSLIVNSILTENFIRPAPLWIELGLTVLLVAFLTVLSFSVRPLVILGVFGICTFIQAGVGIYAFLFYGVLFMTLPGLISLLIMCGGLIVLRTLSEQREKQFLRRTLERYFSPPVVRKIIDQPDILSAGEKRRLTILFSDIVGFTPYCASRSPEEVKRTLNEYFNAMAEIVFRYEGTIDKYIGDGLMVFFGDPVRVDNHALNAVRAAREMQRQCRVLKEQWIREGRLPLKIRIGIHTGEVIVGDMGTDQRMDYTVLGANVNLAQRLEMYAPPEGILLSEEAYSDTRNDVQIVSSRKITVKGLTEEIQVHEVAI